MAVYWGLLVFSAAAGAALCGADGKKSAGRMNIYCVLLAVLLAAAAAFRLSVGYDYNLYAALFYDMNFMSYEEIGYIQRENGMLFPVKILENLTYDYFPAFVMLSAVMYPLVAVYVRKYSDNPWLSAVSFLAFGVYFNSLNFMRQFFAAIICAYAFKYAEKGNYFRFAVFVLLGAAFHRSAFIILLCFWFARADMNKISLAVSLALSGGIYLFSDDIIRFVTRFVYKHYDLSGNPEVINGLPVMYTAMYGAVFLTGFILKNRLKGGEREINILLWCGYSAFFFELIGTKHGIISRMSLLFFIPVVILLVPKIINAACALARERLSKNAGRAAAVIIAVMLCGVYYGLLERNYNGVLPYQTIYDRG